MGDFLTLALRAVTGDLRCRNVVRRGVALVCLPGVPIFRTELDETRAGLSLFNKRVFRSRSRSDRAGLLGARLARRAVLAKLGLRMVRVTPD